MPGYGYLNPSVPQPVGTGLIVGNALANAFQEGLSAFMQARRDKLDREKIQNDEARKDAQFQMELENQGKVWDKNPGSVKNSELGDALQKRKLEQQGLMKNPNKGILPRSPDEVGPQLDTASEYVETPQYQQEKQLKSAQLKQQLSDISPEAQARRSKLVSGLLGQLGVKNTEGLSSADIKEIAPIAEKVGALQVSKMGKQQSLNEQNLN